MIARGVSEAMTQAMVNMAAAKSEGMHNAIQRIPLASSPTSFRQWCRTYSNQQWIVQAALSRERR